MKRIEQVTQRDTHRAGYGRITTEILPLKNYITVEEYHQNHLKKTPDGYCGLGGIGVNTRIRPEKLRAETRSMSSGSSATSAASNALAQPLMGGDLNPARQLLAFEAEHFEFTSASKRTS